MDIWEEKDEWTHVFLKATYEFSSLIWEKGESRVVKWSKMCNSYACHISGHNRKKKSHKHWNI